MGNIAVLDENMINMIAAGEVIERPASVVKELLENSIDAGATKITVGIEDGGRRLISVVDNGCGMDADDLAKAFQPHTTSKIKTSKDLTHISTMGFRGEALASITSIAQAKAASRMQNSIEANCIEIDCGNRVKSGPCSADYGTTIEVRNLFYKLPARRKFLRTANTEMTHIIERFTRIALAHRNLDMTLLHNGRELYRLLSKQSLQERISELLSRPVAADLIETESHERGLEIFALLARPSAARASSKFQYIFLNGRFIHDKFISHAIKEAYRGLIEPDKFPIVFLFLQMPCEGYDVNVHPTKIEVRFYNANLVHSQVLSVLREKLLSVNLDVDGQLPSRRADLAKAGKGTQQAKDRSQRITYAMAEFFKRHRPIQTQDQFRFPGSIKTAAANKPTEQAVAQQEVTTEPAQGPLEPQGKFVQLHDTYIVAQTDEGFVVIDQHALHERIIYEDLCNRLANKVDGKLQSQRLLIPESLELTDAQANAIDANAKLIEKLGIELEPFGPRTVAVQAFPTLLGKISPLEFVRDLLDLLTDKSSGLDEERLLYKVLEMTACKAAIKAGQKLSNAEVGQLLSDRETFQRVSRCPHGRPTTIKFSVVDLEKQFKRT